MMIIIITTTTIAVIIKCRYRTPATTYTELLVILHNGKKPLNIIKKSFPPDAARALYIASETAYSSLNVMNRGDHTA